MLTHDMLTHTHTQSNDMVAASIQLIIYQNIKHCILDITSYILPSIYSNISWYCVTLYIGRSPSAQHRPTQAEPAGQHRSYQEQPSNLHPRTTDDADLVDERLQDSPSNELETFREYQSSDSERESPQSSRSELTESTLIQTQPNTLSNTSEHTVSKSTSMLQPYPEPDVEPCSQYAHNSIWHQSKTVRRNDREAWAGLTEHGSCQEQPSNLFLAKTDDADLVDESLLDSPSNELQTLQTQKEKVHWELKAKWYQNHQAPCPVHRSVLCLRSTLTMQLYPEHDVGPRSQYAHPPIRHQLKITRNERRQNDQEAQACRLFTHRFLLWYMQGLCIYC